MQSWINIEDRGFIETSWRNVSTMMEEMSD